MNKPLPPPTIRRVTVPVTDEVHAVFQRLAKATGMSTGKAMGEWLSDTIDGVGYMADKVEQARAAPALVARELHAYALGLADETSAMVERARGLGKAIRHERTASGHGAQSAPGPVVERLAALRTSAPPSCNTGGKVPSKQAKRRGKPS